MADHVLDESSTAELLEKAIDDSRRLARAEIQLAKDELQSESRNAIGAAGALGIAAFAGLFAFAALLAALMMAVGATPGWGLFIAGATMLVISVAGAAVGYRILPKQLLPRTQRRIGTDARELGEHGV